MNIDKKDHFLAAFPGFKSGPDALLRDILESSHVMTCSARTQIYMEGDTCTHIAFILKGDIRIFKNSEQGREITLYEIGKGETCILNASCILSGSSYPAFATTLSETDMLMLPASVLRRAMNRFEEMRTFVFSLLSHRLSDVMSLVEEIVFGKLDERLQNYLIEKSENDRLVTTHQVIASDLGSSREVISRLLT